MTDSVREHLLGYIFGALEDSDRELVDRHLEDDAELRRELAVLRDGLEPLEASRSEFTPPTGLAERTCRFVASQSREPAPNVAPRAPNTAPSATPKTAVAASGGAGIPADAAEGAVALWVRTKRSMTRPTAASPKSIR